MPLVVLLRRLALALMLVSAFTGAWTYSALREVRSDLAAARTALEQARAADRVDDLRPVLRLAQADLQRSVDRLSQPGPALVSRVPLVGRPARAVERASEAALAVVDGTAGALDAAMAMADVSADGSVDLAGLSAVATELDRAARNSRAPVGALVEQPLGLLPSSVSGPVRTAEDALAGAPETFEQAAAGVRAVSDVLGGDGPRRLLIMLENNAELRGTGGLTTVFAEATAQDGRIEIGAFRDVEEVADPPAQARPVEAPADYQRLWGTFLANTTLWKNVNMSPDIPTSSLVLSRVAAASLGQPPDVVLWFDVPAIAALLRATGPTELPDGSVLDADNAVDVLLSDAYDVAVDTREGQARRRTALRQAADAVLGRVLDRSADGPSPADLAAALAQSARGRHVALWSRDAQEQAELVAAGLAGDVAADGGDLLNFAVQNLGGGDAEGNKLDYYARRRVGVRVVLGPDGAEVEQQVSLRNTAPETGLPTYVAGTGTPGTTNNLVSLSLPASAQLETFTRGGQVVLQEPQPHGDHAVLTDVVSLPPGTETTWVLRYRLPLSPDEEYRLRLVPQPLAVPAELEVEVVAAEGYSVGTPAGSPLEGAGGALVLAEPFEAERAVEVELERPGWRARTLEQVKRFWQEPVTLP